MSDLDQAKAMREARDRWELLPPIERRGGDADRHFPDFLLEAELQELAVRGAVRHQPITAFCSTQYRAIRTSGTRRLSAIELLVPHTTQGLTAQGAASWFRNPACRGSAHVVVDANECYRTLPPSLIPWGAPGANGRGWHLEITGKAEWSRRTWLTEHRETIERAAYKLAWHGKAFKIPLVRLTDHELAAGVKRGVADHAQCSRVFGGTHWDVGEGFPFDVLMSRAQTYRKGLR